MEKKQRPWWIETALLVLWTALTAFFFANVEIQIEGPAGWASNLPTWTVKDHWLLDIFWGGRPMTGYHAWVFSFMFLVFHLGVFIDLKWSLRIEARIIAALMLFWVVEDFLWFVLNPAYGLARFEPAFIPWHKSWALGVPTDYLLFSAVGVAFVVWSFVQGTGKRT